MARSWEGLNLARRYPMKMSVTPGILTGLGIRLLLLFSAAAGAHLVVCLEASTSGRKASLPRRSCTA